MPDMPHRVQLRRTKGWRMPENTVKVDRSTEWGNLYRIGTPYLIFGGTAFAHVKTPAEAVALFRARCLSEDQDIAQLRGKNLACWCALDQPCHADVLLELANTPLRCE